jgi:hypothetical protein
MVPRPDRSFLPDSHRHVHVKTSTICARLSLWSAAHDALVHATTKLYHREHGYERSLTANNIEANSDLRFLRVLRGRAFAAMVVSMNLLRST